MPPRQKVIILKLNLMGDLIDDDGNRYNEAFQRIDYLGRVIPEPEEEPTTSSPSNGGAGAFQPQTLADYNRPDLFYPRRAAIQVDMDCLDEEPPKQDFQFQNRGVQSRGWYDAPFQVQEALVHQDSKYGEFDFDAWQKKLDAIYYPTRNTEESSELVSVNMDLCVNRRKVFPSQVSSVGVSVDTVLCVDRHDPLQHQAGVFKSSDEEDAENAEFFKTEKRLSIDTTIHVDRQRRPDQKTQKTQRPLSIDNPSDVDRQGAMNHNSQKVVSIDDILNVDRHVASSQNSQKLLSIDTDEPVDRQDPLSTVQHPVSTDTEAGVDRHNPVKGRNKPVSESRDPVQAYVPKPPPEPPEYAPEPPEPLLDPKPPEHYDTDVCEVLSHGDTYKLTVMPEEAATPGSCHKRKSPATTLQPPLKLMRTHIGAVVVHPAAAYIIDPGDTYVVYSRGPRPPPPEQWYVLSNPPSSSAGRRSYPPRRSHPNAAYLPDPEETDVVYHMGPRPP